MGTSSHPSPFSLFEESPVGALAISGFQQTLPHAQMNDVSMQTTILRGMVQVWCR
jgi:hypothetical protein